MFILTKKILRRKKKDFIDTSSFQWPKSDIFPLCLNQRVTFWQKYILISAEISKNYDIWHLAPGIKPAEGA